MPTDPPASDLGAIRARLMSYPRVTMYDDDVQALVAAYDAQAARLMEVEAERDAWKNAHDGGECKFRWLYNECRQWGNGHKERADAQAARLAALEQALQQITDRIAESAGIFSEHQTERILAALRSVIADGAAGAGEARGGG